MARGLEALGWHVEAMPRDVIGCEQGVVCGSCGYGCPLGAKQSTLRTWLEDAAGAGARIVVGAKARRVLVENGTAAGVDAGPVQVRCPRGRRRGGCDRDPGAAAPLRPREPERRSRAAAASGDGGLRHLRGGDPAVGGDAAGALLRPVPLPRRRLRGQARDGAAASGAADGGAALGGRGGARAADGEPAAALADRRDPARQRRRARPDRPRRRGDRDVPARARTTRAGWRRGSTAPAASWPPPAHARSSPRTRRMQRWDDGFPPGAFRFGPGRGSLYSFHLMGSARMGGSPAQSAASPTRRDVGCAQPRRRRRLRLSDRLRASTRWSRSRRSRT